MTNLENREAFKKWWSTAKQTLKCDDYDAFWIWQASANREGFKLAPLEPTKAMLIAADNCEIDGKVTAYNIYKAMISAV